MCAHTSEGSPGEAVSDCQIESCCSTCSNDEEAFAQGKGTVCRGSKAGLEKPKDGATVRFDGQVPLNLVSFLAAGYAYRDAVSKLAGVALDNVQILWTAELKTSGLTKELNSAGTWSDSSVNMCHFSMEITTTADNIDLIWTQLYEDAINEALAAASLHPMGK